MNRRSQLAMERIGGVRTGTRIDYKQEKIVYEITRESYESAPDRGPRS